MPDTDEYFVIASERLDALAESRHNSHYEGYVFWAGIAVGAFVSTTVSLIGWLLTRVRPDLDGFGNCMVFAVGVVSAVRAYRFWKKDEGSFTAIVEKIKAGKRYVIDPGTEIPLRPATDASGKNK